MRRFVILLSTAAVAAASLAGPAFAGKPLRGTGDSNVTFDMQVISGPDQVANWNDQVTFTVQQSATDEPHVDLTCTQNGTVVLGATTGFYASYPWPWTQVMTLSSQDWSGGPADCTARLYYFNGRKQPTLKTLSFQTQG